MQNIVEERPQKPREELINEFIQQSKPNTDLISDGYHTFGELYHHRTILYIKLCEYASGNNPVWRSLKHSDGTKWDGWFLLGINKDKGSQVTYHLAQSSYWYLTEFAETLEQAPEFDGHTSEDVLNRIMAL